ncbi:uncharacterized protein LOC109849650 [Asparagus officinalis]|uniref:uncharacterized protein LOC109849650 n=1 Tax=Asparagus officinalis TaxID=4686 RepID=UPI00098E721E|nr:uncharacterized protein LOC109849650 [Asparagus officinalis]
MLAKKRLDEWAPQIDEILSDAKNEIRQRFGEKLYQKKGRQGSDFKKKLPPDGFRAIVRWGHNGIPTGQWANNFSSYLGCLIRRSDNVNPYYEAWEQPFHVLESIYRDCWRYFNIEDNPVGWEFLFGYQGKFKHSLREWRHEIKKKCFDCFTHNWERIYKRDKRVEPEHLAALIILWGQEEHQEALENTYSEVVAQSQEPLTREQNYNVSHLVCRLPKKGRTRWMGVGAQRVFTQFQPPPISTPSTMPSGPSYMPQEDCTQQAMQLVSSVMSMLDGQIPEEMWEDIQEELMRVIQPTATFAMVSRQIMKSCRRRVPTRVQSQIMNFLATQKAFTGSGESSRHVYLLYM